MSQLAVGSWVVMTLVAGDSRWHPKMTSDVLPNVYPLEEIPEHQDVESANFAETRLSVNRSTGTCNVI